MKETRMSDQDLYDAWLKRTPEEEAMARRIFKAAYGKYELTHLLPYARALLLSERAIAKIGADFESALECIRLVTRDDK